jgi:hypothetical protein
MLVNGPRTYQGIGLVGSHLPWSHVSSAEICRPRWFSPRLGCCGLGRRRGRIGPGGQVMAGGHERPYGIPCPVWIRSDGEEGSPYPGARCTTRVWWAGGKRRRHDEMEQCPRETREPGRMRMRGGMTMAVRFRKAYSWQQS